MSSVPKILSFVAVVGAFAAAPATGQPTPQRRPAPVAIAVPPPPYAVIADAVLAAPVIVDARIRGTTRIKGAEAVGVAPGRVRLYVEADVLALIRGSAPLPPRIGYLLDLSLDSRGKLPTLRKARVLLFARAVPRQPGQLQLVRPDSQRNWTAAADALTRRITTEAVAADAPPAIIGIGNAFHVRGDLPGEGETQIFMTTATGQPVSLSIVRRPAQPRRWSVALSDVVDQAVPPPPRDTLLWYRLACALPAALPPAALTALDPADAVSAREDYQFVIGQLGPCER